MLKQSPGLMRLIGIGLIIIFIIQSFLYWNEERVLAILNILCAGTIFVILIVQYKKK
ncbi:hypothetical protein JOD29_000437 [Lysinibacillus composti]|uniref:hypothetical protein n=1 Tax=Lysinibacillus composti TaxID=720633 RepID=UPI0013154DCF|nr:hypothetical protein [Lysinibacillus composti]MBM7607200.1 hypothetical protein [Lysinibacillus composti]